MDGWLADDLGASQWNYARAAYGPLQTMGRYICTFPYLLAKAWHEDRRHDPLQGHLEDSCL